MDYLSVEEALGLSSKQELCLAFIEKNKRLFNTSMGSFAKHQAWEGGYRDHITEVMNIAIRTYYALETIRPLPFSLADALLGCFLHDIEKVFKNSPLTGFDKYSFLKEEFDLSADLLDAIKYTHGEGAEYNPTTRVQSPLAAFIHHCDNTSARIWFDYPKR